MTVTDSKITFDGGAVRYPIPYRYDLIPVEIWANTATGHDLAEFAAHLLEYTGRICEGDPMRVDEYQMPLIFALMELTDTKMPGLLKLYAKALYDGSLKYPPHGWRQGIPLENLLNHALKHAAALEGRKCNDTSTEEPGEEGEDHAAHLVWNTLNIIYFVRKAWDDEDKEICDRLIEFGYRPKPKEKTK